MVADYQGEAAEPFVFQDRCQGGIVIGQSARAGDGIDGQAGFLDGCC